MMLPVTNLRKFCGICIGVVMVAIAGCGPASVTPTPSPEPESSAARYTPIPTLSDIASVQVIRSGPTRQPTVLPLLATLGPSPTAEPATSVPSATPPQADTAAEATAEIHELDGAREGSLRQGHYSLQRPIMREEGQRDWLDPTYPYGGTQFGTREVHLGVEFFNPRFTPILAGGSGQVIYAGDDSETVWGPEADYYGNLVVVQHDDLTTPDGETLYSIYGHMERIAVETGDLVSTGDKLGVVGDTGIAIGPHLHFEVRVGEDPRNFMATRNPALWIEMFARHGTLAGYATDSQGQPLYGTTLLVYDSGNAPRETYTYGSDRANSDPHWGENFVLPDLRAGRYSVVVRDSLNNTLYRENIIIEAGQTTWLDIVVAGSPAP